MLNNKNIILGVCGSIAAYKSASLVRLLVKAGANVKVILTADASNFITPLTLATLSKNPVYTQYFEAETGVWSNHVELGLWADYMIIAPTSANTIGKMANGLCDNLLTAVYLSAKCPVYFAPAMDLDMWKHESTQDNITQLKSFGNKLVSPNSGELASGLFGEGRMAEPEEIITFLINEIKHSLPLLGKNVLVTAGPTYEAIDPVRFIGNHSSGKMGFALAEAAARRARLDPQFHRQPADLPLRPDSRTARQAASTRRLVRYFHRRTLGDGCQDRRLHPDGRLKTDRPPAYPIRCMND